MNLIEPQWGCYNVENHLQRLYILKKCIENSMNSIYVVSKKSCKKIQFSKAESVSTKNRNIETLNKIQYSINHYKKFINV